MGFSNRKKGLDDITLYLYTIKLCTYDIHVCKWPYGFKEDFNTAVQDVQLDSSMLHLAGSCANLPGHVGPFGVTLVDIKKKHRLPYRYKVGPHS